MSDTLKGVLFACGAIVTIAGAVTIVSAVIWWFVKPRLMEALEEHVFRPVRETHHQVTVNHHSSDEPTVLDRLDDVTKAVEAQGAEFESLHENVAGLTEKLMDHLNAQSD